MGSISRNIKGHKIVSIVIITSVFKEGIAITSYIGKNKVHNLPLGTNDKKQC